MEKNADATRWVLVFICLMMLACELRAQTERWTQRWTSDSLSNRIEALAVDAAHPEYIYAGTQHAGTDKALVRSADAGATWSETPGNPFTSFVTAIACDPEVSGTVIVGTSVDNLYKSMDHGTTWHPLACPNPKIKTIAVDPQDPNTLYVGAMGTASVGSIFKGSCTGCSENPSDPFAYTWTEISTGDLRSAVVYALAIDPHTSGPGLTLWAATADKGVWKSPNGGGSWARASVGLPYIGTPPNETYQAVYALALDPNTTASATLWAATYRGLHRTQDGGATWPGHYFETSYFRSLAYDPGTTGGQATLWAGDNAGPIRQTTDGGVTWTNIDSPSSGIAGVAMSLALDARSPRVLWAGSSSSGVYSYNPPCSSTTCGAEVPTSGQAGVPVAFNGYQQCIGATNAFSWAFGDGAASNEQNPSHSYAAAGTYAWELTATADGQTCTQSGAITITPPCTLACTATVPVSGIQGSALHFSATVTPSNCAGTPSFAWAFGDGATSAEQNPSHSYAVAGSYGWTLTVSVDSQTCTETGTITITPPELPGDCNGDGTVSIGEVQKAINMFLGIEPVGCGADGSGDGSVSIGEVQRVINAFLGVQRSGGFVVGPTPSLSLGSPSGVAGQTVSVPVTLGTNGAGVAAASYRVTYDPGLLTFAGAAVGGAGAAAGKDVAVNGTQPGVVILGVLGMNRNLIGDGTLATLSFAILPTATGAAVLSGTCGASDADGNDLPTACAQGSVTVPTLAGRVTLGGAGLAGVAVAAGPYSATTDPSGSWAMGGVAAGSYAVRPYRAGYAFAPASRSVTFSGGALYGLDFAASEDFRISGSVTFMEEGTPVSGVAVSAVRAEGGAYAAATDAAGAFLFGGLPTGSYTVTPSKKGLLFSPADFGVIPLSGEWTAEEGVSFRAFPTGPYRISGFVRQDGAPLAGVLLRLEGWPQEATTNALGHYSIGSLASGYDYAVLPSMRCKRFTPAYLDVFDLAGDVGSQSFAASQVSLCQPCFAALDLEMARCLGAPDPPACSEGARVRFGACLHEATAQANTPLYEATLLAIAVPRAAGGPVPVTVPLGVEAEGDYFVNVVNGDQANGETMVTSATVDLSGAGRVFGPGDFKKQVPFLSAPVHLAPGAYELSVEVRGQPGSYLTVVVSDLDFGTVE